MKVLTLGDYLEQALNDRRHVIRVVSALIIAVLVTVILALLGISFLLMSETEYRLAPTE